MHQTAYFAPWQLGVCIAGHPITNRSNTCGAGELAVFDIRKSSETVTTLDLTEG